MKKLKIKTTIISENKKITENLTGSLESGIISYKENNDTYVYLDINRNELIRENDEMVLKFLFEENKETIGIVFIKELKKELEIILKTDTIKKEDNKYYVTYEIENNIFTYEIEYMEVEV